MELLERGHPDKGLTSFERPLDNGSLNINVLISTPDKKANPLERPNQLWCKSSGLTSGVGT